MYTSQIVEWVKDGWHCVREPVQSFKVRFGISNVHIFQVVGAGLVAYLAYSLTRLNVKRKERAEAKGLRRHILRKTSMLCDSLEHQSDIYAAVAREMGAGSSDVALKTVAGLSAKSITDTPDIELYRILVLNHIGSKKHREYHFAKFSKRINSVEEFTTVPPELYEEYGKHMKEGRDELDNAFLQYQLKLGELVQLHATLAPASQQLVTRAVSINNSTTGNRWGHKALDVRLIRPVRELCMTNLDVAHAGELFRLTNAYSGSYMGLKRSRRHYATAFWKFAEDLKMISADLRESSYFLATSRTRKLQDALIHWWKRPKKTRKAAQPKE